MRYAKFEIENFKGIEKTEIDLTLIPKPNIFTLVVDLFPKQAVSSVTGIGSMSGAVGGMLFPLLVGYILDQYKSAGNLVGGYNLLFIICGFTYLFAWTIIHLLTRKSDTVHLSEIVDTKL